MVDWFFKVFQNHVTFKVWPYVQRSCRILWSFWWHHGLQILKSLNFLQLSTDKPCSKTFCPEFLSKQWTSLRPCQQLSPSMMPLSYPIMILSTITNEPIYICKIPNIWFLVVSQLSLSFAGTVSTIWNFFHLTNIKNLNIYNIKYIFFVLFCMAKK